MRTCQCVGKHKGTVLTIFNIVSLHALIKFRFLVLKRNEKKTFRDNFDCSNNKKITLKTTYYCNRLMYVFNN